MRPDTRYTLRRNTMSMIKIFFYILVIDNFCVWFSTVFDHKSYKVTDYSPSPGDAKSELGYPPSEPKIDSKKYRHNFTSVLMDFSDTWNSAPGPFSLYPFLPTDRSLPTDAQYLGILMLRLASSYIVIA